jgi:hypothetical protein
MLRLALSLLLALPVLAVAQDDPVKKQKDAAADNLKLANLDKVVSAETDAILLYTTQPEAKAKALAAAAQKSYDAAVKVLKVEDKAKLWPGKLTAVVLPTRTNYNSFVRLVLKDRPEAVESHRVNSLTDAPFVLIGVEPGTTPTDASLADELGQAVAAVTLARKVGTRTTATVLPYWLTEGFGTVVVARAEGNAAKLTALKAKQRATFGKKTVGSFKVGNVWGTDKVKDQDVLAASFVEFLLFGPDAKFDKFVNAFKPGENANGPVPTSTALAALEWTDEAALDNLWKGWVVKNLNK